MFYSSTNRRFLTRKIYLLQIKLLSYPEKLRIKALSQKKGWVGVCRLRQQMTLYMYGTVTSLAKLFAHGQHICNYDFTLNIGTAPPKKITSLKKGCNLRICFGNSTLQHLHIRPHNSYKHCEKLCKLRGEWLAKCYH